MGDGDSNTIFGNLPAPRSSSFEESKHPRGQPENKGRFRSLAGVFSIGTKPPDQMTYSERAKEHRKLSLHSSALGRQMINEGRGFEKPTETKTKSDPLSRMINAVDDRMRSLKIAHEVSGDIHKHGFLPQQAFFQ